MKRSILYILLYVLPLCAIVACTDDILYNPDDRIPEGESVVTAMVEFKPLSTGLAGKTRAEGTAIKTIENLCLLLYNQEGELVKKYTDGDFLNYEVTDEVRKDSDADNNYTAEEKTPCATFQLKKVPYGRYYIYAVANMGDLSDYSESINTIDGLKSIPLTWNNDPEKVAKNNQMFGYFTGGKDQTGELMTISSPAVRLHTWIRRAASKVTVAYDATNLKENIYIFLKSVQIKHIPSQCYLGKDNNVGFDGNGNNELAYQLSNNLLDGEKIYFNGVIGEEDKNYANWPRLTKGENKYGLGIPEDPNNVDLLKDHHNENVPALYFYENIQGIGKDKRQDYNNDGKLDAPGVNTDPSDEYYKDQKPYGSYIEVKAFYISNNTDKENKVGSGDITYRFMLGQNVWTDYNAKRNTHYKLTLKFNGYANDIDWHIEYEEPVPSILAPDVYYISYLYNHTMNLPVKVNPGPGRTVTSLTATIDSNFWAPYDAPQSEYASNYDPQVTKSAAHQPWNGFLSLRRTLYTLLTNSSEQAQNSQNALLIGSNQAYYEDVAKPRGKREYKVFPGEHEAAPGEQDNMTDGDGIYTVGRADEDGIVDFQIPLYTRAKSMIKETGYTVNNPYVAYMRKAIVTLKATTQNNFDGNPGPLLEKKVIIYQVRRIVNPKGVYRKHDNIDPFHVVLKRLPEESALKFVDFVSEGPWRAYIIRGDKNFINLDGKSEVSGSTGTKIDFNINFLSECGENESRNAIIRVEYHNYTCVHLIFVRQGYAPMQLYEGDVKWHSYNMYTGSEEAAYPMEEGSLFRFGNTAEPIDASNQVNDRNPWINVTPWLFKDHSKIEFLIAGTADTKRLWINIESTVPTEGGNNEFNLPDFTGEGIRVANMDDIERIKYHENIEFGFGVLYGDDAKETLSDISQVYGYRRSNHGNGYGMRGCFVYNSSENGKYSGRNLFFPLGASGYGHRKDYAGKSMTEYRGEVGDAVLRYACGRAGYYPNSALPNAPLFYDLYMRPGAIYWAQKLGGTHVDAGKMIALDINYFNFDFGGITISSLKGSNGTDACFVRCVEE